MMNNKYILLFSLLIAAQVTFAQKTKAELILSGARYAVYEDRGCRLLYREVRVKGDMMGKPALLIYLHGGHDSGADNAKQVTSASIKDITGYLVNNNVNSVVLAPQCPKDRMWNEEQTDGARTMSDVVDVWLKDYISKNDIDRSHIYIVGVAEGGEGVWRMTSDCPGLFAAAIVVASMPRFVDYGIVAKTPLCCILTEHDVGKKAVEVEAFTDSITACKGEVRLDILKGASHREACDEAFTDARMQWLLTHVKSTDITSVKESRQPPKRIIKRKSERH